jgi:ribonuclease P protein component
MSGPSGRKPSFGYTRSSRLLTPSDFRTVFKRNVRSHDRYFTVLAHRSGNSPRLGSAVARKACGSAVGRNRLKRIIRESFRHARERLPKVDLVVIVKPGAGKIANPQLRDSLEKHWQVITNKCVR